VKRRLERERGLVPKELAKRKNPLVPWPVARAVWTSLTRLKAGDKWPAVLARASPTTPAGGAYEGGARAPPRGAPALGEEVSWDYEGEEDGIRFVPLWRWLLEQP